MAVDHPLQLATGHAVEVCKPQSQSKCPFSLACNSNNGQTDAFGNPIGIMNYLLPLYDILPLTLEVSFRHHNNSI